ncbi:gamma-glutamylaminecyclotransferase isoform X2 [Ornithorhynchus anatinus]|nr:gamma-glutamylaminecyclotransferase isoform X2 [Ornithorhynchus anatinus]XP_007666189.1 gamma-glutamylaminecyclotransferase isoform X2 [Ornithorhynchus anatinus]XP_028929509.1 gamma-glutamylaminecyclotransferase isoform X2 [Ornithorhynchus anatinus]
MARLFIYGTLKKGQPNSSVITDPANGKSEFLGRGRTVEKYPLVIAGQHNIPFLLHVPGKGHRVAGEMYSVDNQMLQVLDEFEQCPDVYQRTLMRIEVLEWEGKSEAPEEQPAVNSTVECFVYSTSTFQPEWLNLPFYDSYNNQGEHGLRYNPRENR